MDITVLYGSPPSIDAHPAYTPVFTLSMSAPQVSTGMLALRTARTPRQFDCVRLRPTAPCTARLARGDPEHLTAAAKPTADDSLQNHRPVERLRVWGVREHGGLL